MSRKKLKLFLFLTIGAVLMCNTNGYSADVSYAQYTSKISGLNIAMEYPVGWTFRETRNAKAGYAHVIFIENVKSKELKAFISVTAETAGNAAETIKAKAEEIANKRLLLKDTKILSKSTISLLGTDAIEIILSKKGLNKLYAVDAKMIPLKEVIVVLKKGSDFYILNYQNKEESFDSYNSAFSHIIKTLQFKK